jgi:predicted TIM-barrel fold metal-dependent hydrolase
MAITRRVFNLSFLGLGFGLASCTESPSENPAKTNYHSDLLIDMHTHCFNGAYASAHGVFRGFSIPENASSLLEKICMAIFILRKQPTTAEVDTEKLRELVSEDPGLDFEQAAVDSDPFRDYISEGIAALDSPRSDISTQLLEDDPSIITEKTIQLLEEDVKESIKFIADIKKAIESAIDSEDRQSKLLGLCRDAEERIKRITEELSRLPEILEANDDRTTARTIFGNILYSIVSIFAPNQMIWFGLMLRRDISVFAQILKDLPSVDVFVHYMIEMEIPFNKDDLEEHKPYISSFSTRVERIGNICTSINNLRPDKRFYAFIPYHPARGDEFFKVFEKIFVNNKDKDPLFLGVKFYPPLGYKPLPENNEEWRSANEKLFQLCKDNRLPILCHTQHGSLRPEARFNEYANPIYWREVFDNYPGLKFCFAHAGGAGKRGDLYKRWYAWETASAERAAEGWFVENWITFKQTWAFDVFKFCCQYKNVYCDFSAFSEITIPHYRERLEGHLTKIAEKHREVLSSVENPTKFFDRVMFGTDWHMIYNGHERTDYVDGFKTLFTAGALKDFNDKFFCLNAKNYLGI